MSEFGNLQPIVFNVRTQTLVSGHQRLKIMLANGVAKADVWCVDLDPAKEKAANVALNSLVGDWDRTQLEAIIAGLRTDGVDLDLTGFGDDGIDGLLSDLRADEMKEKNRAKNREDIEPRIDLAGELKTKWKTEPGQVWALGDHRLICGDSAAPEVFAGLMPEAELGWLLITDPPYGVEYEDVETHRRQLGSRNVRKESDIGEEEHDPEALIEMVAAVFVNCANRLNPGSPAYVTCSSKNLPGFITSFIDANFHYSRCLVWVKNNFTFGMGDYHYRHEPILYGWLKGAAHRWYGGTKQDTVLEFDKPMKSPEHPTMKPVDLIIRLIENSSRYGDVVIDPFAGSGTTLLACERTHRKARLIERKPEYVAVTLERFREATGVMPELLNAVTV